MCFGSCNRAVAATSLRPNAFLASSTVLEMLSIGSHSTHLHPRRGRLAVNVAGSSRDRAELRRTMSVVCPNPGFSGGLESRYHPNDLLPKSVAGSRAARPPQQWRRSALSVLNPRRREEDAAESCADGRRSDAVAERNLRHASSLVKPGGILKSRASIAHRD